MPHKVYPYSDRILEGLYVVLGEDYSDRRILDLYDEIQLHLQVIRMMN